DRQGEVNGAHDRGRPKPGGKTVAEIMPDRSRNHASERHRQYEFPGEVHDLIDARSRKSAAQPDVNEEQDRQLGEEPDVGWDKRQPREGRVPAAEKQRYAETADRE